MVNRAIVQEKMGKQEEAIKILEEAIVVKGSDRRIHTNLGIIHRKVGNLEESEKHLNFACEQSQILEQFSSASSSESDADQEINASSLAPRSSMHLVEKEAKKKQKKYTQTSEVTLINRLLLKKENARGQTEG